MRDRERGEGDILTQTEIDRSELIRYRLVLAEPG